MKEIMDRGHSRVPVYYKKKTNIIGLILVKSHPFYYFNNLSFFLLTFYI